MNRSEKIKNYLLNKLGMDLVGIAPAEALADEPEGRRPTDILPGAKSIVVFGKRMSVGAVQAAMRVHEDGNKYAESIYSTYAADVCPGMVLFFDTFNASQYIERNYRGTAVPLPLGPMQNGIPVNTELPMFSGPYKAGIPMNINRAALAAGLGEYGWSNHFLTPEFGPRVVLGAVITNLELEYDAPYNGRPLCEPDKCGLCAKLCPVGAIGCVSVENETGISVPGKSCRVSQFAQNRCSVAAMELPVAAELMNKPGGPEDSDIAAAMKKLKINDYTLDHYPKFKCDECLLYCPAGDWEKKYRARGLSNMKGEG